MSQQRAGRRADLGREIRQGADFVADEGGGAGELVSGELHAVAGVTGETDDDVIQLADFFVGLNGVCQRIPFDSLIWASPASNQANR